MLTRCLNSRPAEAQGTAGVANACRGADVRGVETRQPLFLKQGGFRE